MRRSFLIGVIVSMSVAGAAVGAQRASGIAGKVEEGPTCPVERVPADPQCAPRPLAASLRVHPVGRASPTWMVHSGTDGRFSLRLAPGEYVVKPLARRGSPFPRPPSPTQVAVRRTSFTHITITYDTGIR